MSKPIRVNVDGFSMTNLFFQSTLYTYGIYDVQRYMHIHTMPYTDQIHLLTLSNKKSLLFFLKKNLFVLISFVDIKDFPSTHRPKRYQKESSPKSMPVGTGLGLALASGVAKVP